MAINIFFISIASILVAIFVLFKPIKLSQMNSKEFSLIDSTNMKIYKIDESSLKSTLYAKDAHQFKDRIEFEDVEYIKNMKDNKEYLDSKYATYKENIITLTQNVLFKTDDGVKFKTAKAIIEEKSDTLKSDGKFTLSKDGSYVNGVKLIYNSKTKKVKAKNIKGIYKL
jgi:LPS export ABC transporter protein LptC